MSEFDKFSSNYTKVNDSLARNLTGFDLNYFNEYKIKDLHSEIGAIRSKENLKILDFGCGVGNSLPFLNLYFPNSEIHGVDVSLDSIKLAESTNKCNKTFYHHLKKTLPFKEEEFDVIFSACVFHHIPIDERMFWIKDLRRIMRRDGLLVIYEHNPLNPVTQYVFRTAEFDKDAHMISSRSLAKKLKLLGFNKIHCKYRAYFPKWLRPLLKLEPYLMRIPLGAQYYIACFKE